MKIPSKVKIGGLVYTVKETNTLSLGTNYSGEILYSDLCINIRSSCARQQRERSFIHEVIHGIFDNLGYYDHDEKKIDELAGALYSFIIDNPEIFETKQEVSE